jgi:hypothetical protein
LEKIFIDQCCGSRRLLSCVVSSPKFP